LLRVKKNIVMRHVRIAAAKAMSMMQCSANTAAPGYEHIIAEARAATLFRYTSLCDFGRGFFVSV
jgi:formate/nitrite transporter FocA (FNT family)